MHINKSYKPDYINKKIDYDVKKQIEEYEIIFRDLNNYNDREYEYVSMWDYEISELNIEGYSKLYQSYDRMYYTRDEEDLKNYQVSDRKNEVVVIVDMESFAREMALAQKEKRKEKTFEEIRYVKTNREDVIFCVNQFSLTYELYSNKLESFSVDGFLLVK